MLSPSTKRFRPHFTNIPGSRQIIPPGGQLTLSCTAVGAPVPNVQWFRDQQHLPGDQLNKQPPGTAKLTLTNLLESFNVTCIAESTMGRIYHEVQIIVKNLPNPPGDFQIIEISATHARIAMKPSNSSLSAVRNYLILWLPSSQFTNQTLYELSQQANILISQPPDQTEPLLLSNNEDTRPNLIMLPKILKNISRSSLTSQYSHQTIRDLDINQQTTETINPTFMYNILMISLTQLKPYTEYTLWARTVGPDGDTSLPNKPFLFTTKELAPSSPPLNVHAQALSNAAVTVYWDPPLEPNGRIRAYRIYYTHNPTLEFSYWDTSIVNLQALQSPSISTATIYNKNTNNLNVDSDEQTNIPGHLSILSHLTTNATYYIRVSAVNGQGEGPASDILVVIVRPGVLSKPQNFTAITKSSHEILLTWKPPNDVDMNTRPLEYYELEYEPISDYKMSTDRLTWLNVQNLQGVNKKQHLSSIRIMSDITTYLLNNLEPDTRYLFNLVAVSKAGHGVRASTFARTNQFIPSAPTNLSVEAISPTQLQVKWKHPLINNQLSDDTVSSTRIAYYDLNWRQSDSEGSWSRSDVPSGNHHSQTWFNLSSSASSLTSSTINNGLFETNTFGSLQIPSYNNFNENFTNSINSWYIANITGLQPSTYYVIHLRAVSPSGTGDTATSRPVKTWNEPPPAPQKLRLISQIIPQPSSNLPPQILLRISWEPVWYDDYSTLSVDEKPVSYRIRWRLIGGERNLKKKLQSTIQRSIRSIDTYSSESTLHWPIIDSKQQHHPQPMDQFTTNDVNNPFQSDLLIPTKLLNGEVNVTETSWNAASDIFLLGMSYEFRVAVITPLQVGYEALETVSFEGTAPTNTPTSIHVSYILDQIIISWNPPDWDHRHGIFEAYELKCYHSRSMNVNNSNEIINKHYEEGLIHYNVTLLNSRVQWPISAPNDLLNIIPWPSGQIQLNIPMKLNYYYYGKIDENDNNERLIKYTYACIIRAINVYGFGPWSTEKIILPKKTFIPPPPENIRAIFLHQHQLRISWSLPVNMLQSISSNLIKKLNQREINNLLIYSGNSYSHFAIYISPKTKTNWKRYTTKGPTTELVLDDYNEDITYLVRISTVSINEHESKWSDAISTQRIQSSTISMLAIKVYHLKCYLFYRSETDLWQLQLKWEVPKQLQTDPYFDQLSHYRINYTVMKTNLKYITTHSVINRESSLNKLDEYKNKFILEHSVYTSESNSIYAVSIRPVFKGISSQTDTSIYVNRPYGIVENSLCYIPRNDILHVPVPVILLNPFIDKHTNHFLIGLKPIQWIHTPLSHSAGAAASTASLFNQDILMIYELVAYKLPIHQSIQYVEQLKLGQWNSTDLFIHSTSQSNQVHIELSQPLQDTSLRYEKRSAKLFVGKALPLNQDYALCIKVCLQPNQQFYSFNIMDNGVKHEPICYESKWIQPVSTNRPSPSLDSFSDSIDHLFNGSLYDPDRLIWESKSFGTHSPPPSDDATAQEPNRVNDNENHQLNEILHKYHQLPQVTIKQTDDVINRSVLHKNLLLSPSVTQEKYFTELNKYNLTDDHKSSIHSPWKQRYQLSYTIWHRLTLNKQKSNKKLFNLTEMHSPPPGNGMYSNEQFDSLRIDTLRNEMNSNYVTDSPNTNDNYTTTRLNRVDSISSSYRPYQINSPPLQLSTLNNGIYGTHCMKSNQNEFNGLGGLGSLKSVSTMGSKSLQPINTIDSINVNDNGLLSSPISNGHCRNLLNGQQTHRPIQVANLIEHVQNLKADNGRLMAAEFESIDPGGPFTWEHSNRPSNRNKNRYANVIAYDHSRVVLQLNANNDPDSDYINANYLDGYRKQNAYIATQGPLPHTITDFWRMVWEQRSRMIVSMTRLEEKARIKCEQYWPSNFSTGSGINSSNSHSNMNRNNNNNNSMMMSCRPSPSISSRLNSTSYNKKLNDFILKLGDKSILPPPMNFRTSINLKEIHGEQHVDEYNGDDNNNQMINGDLIFTNGLSHLSHSTINFGEISVSLLDTIELAYYTVRSFVLQKVGTLETREVRQLQFTAWPDHGVPNHPAPLLMFLRRVRAECPTDSGPIIVHCSAGVGRTGAFILLDILLEQMRHEKAVDVFNTVSRLRAQRNFMVQTEDQYAFIYEALVEAASSAMLPVNLPKNRNLSIIPHDANRVVLRAVRGVEGSDYINASYIDGYKSRAGYIATQAPLMNTLEDFWRMIWESGSCLIVKLDSTIASSELKFVDS
ncbi:Receptor-type tyrosine-protein phosphatase F, partial [Schistosoma japonicum]